MTQDKYSALFLIKTLTGAAFAALVLVAAAAHAQPPRDSGQHQSGNDYNFLNGGGG